MAKKKDAKDDFAQAQMTSLTLSYMFSHHYGELLRDKHWVVVYVHYYVYETTHKGANGCNLKIMISSTYKCLSNSCSGIKHIFTLLCFLVTITLIHLYYIIVFFLKTVLYPKPEQQDSCQRPQP